MIFRRSRLIWVAVLMSFVVSQSPVRADEEANTPVVENGKQISIEYTLKLDDGSTADTNVEREPLVFVQGSNHILPAFEAALIGLKVGESKAVKLSPEDGYGIVNPDAFRTVKTESIPEGSRKVGATLIAQDGQGNRSSVRVIEVREQEIVLDLNHPLAGQNLNFDVRILAIE